MGEGNKRTNGSALARYEQHIIKKLVRVLPQFVTPDMLTILAFAASIGIGVSYFLVEQNKLFYIIVSLLMGIHWFGDSLDGATARYRKKIRPNYGHYIDHFLDSVTIVIVTLSIYLSDITTTNAWIMLMISLLLTMMHTFLRYSIFRNFELDIGGISMTEVRLLFIGLNMVMYFFGNVDITVMDITMTTMDFFGYVTFVGSSTLLIPSFFRTATYLNKKDKCEYWK